jgi:hypothetical protein
MLRLVAHCVVFCQLLLLPAVALAQNGPEAYPECGSTPSDGDVAAAQGLFQAGKTSFNEADYARAISYWEDAYRRDCTAHLLLMNLARAYELNDQKAHALVALETYQARNPGSAQDSALAKRIQKLKEQIESERQTVAETAAPAPEVEAPPPVAVADEPAESDQPSDPPSQGRSIVPLIIAGAGGALMIGGGIVWIGAVGEVKDVEDACGGRNCDGVANGAKLREDGNAARKRANITGAIAVVGAGAAVGGILWYFLQDPGNASTASSRRTRRPSVIPELAPGYTGVSLTGAF